MSDKLDELMENEVSVDLEKREFMSKFGKYAVVSVGMAALMTPNASASFNSGCKPRRQRRQHRDNGWGNGNDESPGRSHLRNNGENTHTGNPHRIHGNPHPDD